MSDLARADRATGFAGVGLSTASTLHGTAYRADIDGLRAVAVGAVVIGHFWPWLLPGGYVGVDVFFVISGFLITQILTRELAQGGFSLAGFYGRRARRLFPALFAVLAATFAVSSVVMLPIDLAAMLRALLATVFFSANLLFWRQSTNYFDATETVDNPLLHLWSLGVEEQFYLFFPWLLMAVFVHAARRARDPLVLLRRGLWVLALLNLVLAGVVTLRNANAAFYVSPLRAWEFMAGALAALHPAWRAPARGAGRWLGQALAGASLLTLVACMALYTAHTRFPGWAALPPVLAAAVLLHTGRSGHFVARFLSLAPLVGLGLISYSLYLWHWPVLVLARHQQALPPPPLWLPLLLGLAVLLSVLTWRYVEQPWRRPRTQRPQGGAAWALASVLGLVTLSVLGLMRQGFEGRVPVPVQALDQVRMAAVPFNECADRPVGKTCVLGDRSVAPDVLLWGDSHLLSWAPALDRVMADARRGAVVNAHLACAPLLELRNTHVRRCAQASQDVWAHLQAHPQLRTVVIAAYWSHYFRAHSPSQATGPGGEHLQGLDAARHGLQATLAHLLASGREVVLIGPVPTYPFNVPQTLALHTWQERPMRAWHRADQALRQGDFWRAAHPWREVPRLRLIDPAAWFCASGTCVLQDQGLALYRDEQHLSAAGARWAERPLALHLGIEPAPVQP